MAGFTDFPIDVTDIMKEVHAKEIVEAYNERAAYDGRLTPYNRAAWHTEGEPHKVRPQDPNVAWGGLYNNFFNYSQRVWDQPNNQIMDWDDLLTICGIDGQASDDYGGFNKIPARANGGVAVHGNVNYGDNVYYEHFNDTYKLFQYMTWLINFTITSPLVSYQRVGTATSEDYSDARSGAYSDMVSSGWSASGSDNSVGGIGSVVKSGDDFIVTLTEYRIIHKFNLGKGSDIIDGGAYFNVYGKQIDSENFNISVGRATSLQLTPSNTNVSFNSSSVSNGWRYKYFSNVNGYIDGQQYVILLPSSPPAFVPSSEPDPEDLPVFNTNKIRVSAVNLLTKIDWEYIT